MRKIILIGDSWGVPNYFGSPGILAEQHTEYLLKNLGYDVINFSLNGNGNDKSISLAIDYIDQGNNADWIIWFHTEMLRERHLIDISAKYKISNLIQEISYYIYKKFKILKEKSNAKTLIIGGQAPVLDTCNSYDYIIKDWRSDICKQILPQIHSLTHLDLIENKNCCDTIEEKTILLNQHKTIFDAMEKSKHFPDNCHPGVTPHKDLSKFIDNLIKHK
jgi:hypothetical protein